MRLPSTFTFHDLYTHEGLARLDTLFLEGLELDVAQRLKSARAHPPSGLEESVILLDLAPYVEDFLAEFFSVQKEVEDLQDQAYALAPLFRCKRLFIQRQAAKAFSLEEVKGFDGDSLKRTLEDRMGEPYTDLSFAHHVLASEDESFLEIARQYAAWALTQNNPPPLFKLPRKIDPQRLILVEQEGDRLHSPHRTHREGFDCTDKGTSFEEALSEAHYCIICHPQGKDSCSKGLSPEAPGCPLEQKISEMNSLRAQGYVLGALAMIMVDNPLVAATGRRICNACRKACIFQKQDSVDVPSVETQTLESVLNLPWGVEIYSLLSRWNPLNLRTPVPKEPTDYKVLVAGMGPAGFTLAHYLLNEGHQVVGVDGMKIEPLAPALLENPIHRWEDIKVPLSQRTVTGFGGVAEYGITVRWDKNYLTLIRLLLERRSHFSLYDGVQFGSTLTTEQAFERGFDHVALCLGAGKPQVFPLKNGLARGVRTASDFLMALQLTGAHAHQIRLPLVVIGGGLTAVDTATEALAYYPIQVERFLKRTEERGGLPSTLSLEEQEIAGEFLRDARALRAGDRSCLERAVTILYRKSIQESPAYRGNAEELDFALREGVVFHENTALQELDVDCHGHLSGLTLKTAEKVYSQPCRTLLVAIGTQPHDADILVDDRVSVFGDLDPAFHGSVVGAMASAKKGYGALCQTLQKRSPVGGAMLAEELLPVIHDKRFLTPDVMELVIKAPQAARNLKPGQFFRFQPYGSPGTKGMALTGIDVDKEKGLVSLIILASGASAPLTRSLEKGQRIHLMGPTGAPTEIPEDETVLLIGGGLGNAVLLPIGRALKEKRNRTIFVAGYRTPQDRFKVEDIEAFADQILWCFEEASDFIPGRSQDKVHIGNVIEGLVAHGSALPLTEISHLLTIGPDTMMAAVARARKTVLAPYLNPGHTAIGGINSPMQCMMKGVCGQCIQLHTDPVTGESKVVFSCVQQDQPLDHVDFEVLHGRVRQNSLLAKQMIMQKI